MNTMKTKYLIFYEDVYDGSRLVWQTGKKYKVTGETESVYYCEGNDANCGIEKSITNMYYVTEE